MTVIFICSISASRSCRTKYCGKRKGHECIGVQLETKASDTKLRIWALLTARVKSIVTIQMLSPILWPENFVFHFSLYYYSKYLKVLE
jgi:hypothetical protein